MGNGLIASSFVPDDNIQRLRQYGRRIFDLNTSISRNLVKLDQGVQRCNIRISNYISTTDSKSYRSSVKLISEGVTGAGVLVGEQHGRTINRHGRETLVKALIGVINDTDIDMISQLVEEIEFQQRHKDGAQKKMTELCKEWFPDELERLQTMPGVKERSATSMIAEAGTDMAHFQPAPISPRMDELLSSCRYEIIEKQETRPYPFGQPSKVWSPQMVCLSMGKYS